MKKESEKSSRKSIGNAIFCVLVFLLAALIVLTLTSKITGKSILPYSVLWVLSGSMEDTIPESSYILVRTVDPENVEVGDVITFRSTNPILNGSFNTHRVTEVIGDHESFITKGDNPVTNPIPDVEPVPAENVVALYVCNLPVLTAIGRLYSKPAGLIITVALMFGGIAIWLVLNVLEKKAQTDKDAQIQRLIEEEVRRLQEKANEDSDHPQT